MEYRVDTVNSRTYLRFTVHGEQTFANNQKLVDTIVASCTEHGVARALVDIRAYHGQVGTVWDFELARLASEKSLGVVKRTAIVADPKSAEFTSFFETAARNQGINLRAFVDPDAALTWITGA